MGGEWGGGNEGVGREALTLDGVTRRERYVCVGNGFLFY